MVAPAQAEPTPSCTRLNTEFGNTTLVHKGGNTFELNGDETISYTVVIQSGEYRFGLELRDDNFTVIHTFEESYPARGPGTYSNTFSMSDFVGAKYIVTQMIISDGAPVGTLSISCSTPSTATDPSKDAEVVGLLTAQSDSANRFAQSQIQNFNDRLEQLHNEGDRRQNSLEIAFGVPGRVPTSSPIDAVLNEDHQTLPSSMLAYGTDGVSESSSAPRPIGDGFDLGRYAVWTGGFVNFGERDDGGLDLEHTMVGVSGGVDYRFSDRFVVGFGAGYGHDESDIGENGTESSGEAYSAALYGSYEPVENFFIDGLIGGSWLDFDSSRYITENGGFASGDREGRQLFGSLTAAYEFRKEAWLVSPYGRLEFSRSWLDGFTEEGGDIYSLSYGDQTVDSLSGVLGFRAAYTFLTDWGTLTPGFRAEYTHDFAGSSGIDFGYADLDDLAYSLETDPEGEDYGTLGLSLEAQFLNGWASAFDYRAAFGDDRQDHGFGVQVRRSF